MIFVFFLLFFLENETKTENKLSDFINKTKSLFNSTEISKKKPRIPKNETKRPKIEKKNETENDLKVKKLFDDSLWLVPMEDILQRIM